MMNTHKLTSLLVCVALPFVASLAQGQSVLIDFGANNSPGNWNNVTALTNGTVTVTNLIDTNGVETGINIVTTGFNGASNTGSSEPLGDWPVTATGDFIYGQAGTQYANPTITLSNLDVNLTYDFEIFASRSGVSDIRESLYTYTGANSGTAVLEAANNTTETVLVTGIAPDATGSILLAITNNRWTQGGNNAGINNFFYINAMEMTTVPEPSTYALLSGVSILAFVAYRRRRLHRR